MARLAELVTNPEGRLSTADVIIERSPPGRLSVTPDNVSRHRPHNRRWKRP